MLYSTSTQQINPLCGTSSSRTMQGDCSSYGLELVVLVIQLKVMSCRLPSSGVTRLLLEGLTAGRHENCRRYRSHVHHGN